MLRVPLNMGMRATHCQGISQCLEIGHADYYDCTKMHNTSACKQSYKTYPDINTGAASFNH